MYLPKILWCAAAAPLALAAWAGVGACTSSVTSPTATNPPPGVHFVGSSFGKKCSDDIYTIAGTDGWAFCDDGVWAYTTSDPGAYGYSFTEDVDGGPIVQDPDPPIGGGQGQH
jgi:hypothetical protein